MTDNLPATTVSKLVAKVTQSTANIAAHRAAMADVAAQAAVNNAQQHAKGGVKQ